MAGPQSAPKPDSGGFHRVRALTEAIAEPLSAEDQTAQSMPDVSPTKWHRAHVSWFFEEFVLGPHSAGYAPYHPSYRYLFNSYYDAVGDRHPRPERGVVTRPGIDEVAAYRERVDCAMAVLLDGAPTPEVRALVELGLHHEQQHQELMLMDIKHVLSRNVLDPVYRTRQPRLASAQGATARWSAFPCGLVEVGHRGDCFAFDNESGAHRHHLEPFELASLPVTCGEVLAFIADDGYRRSELWLSDGWMTVAAQDWEAPLYWRKEGGDDWSVFTLAGRVPIDPAEPVCHVSYFEADAIARWAGCRLPTEFEWETAAAGLAIEGNLLDMNQLHPRSATDATCVAPAQLFGDVWEWTASAYLPYPGFRTSPGAVGEYNGKFMVNQQVLRGGSCLTPPGHVRPTYRNFFPPSARWPMAGLRLARDPEAP